MKHKIIFGTGNAHKLEELREITRIFTGNPDFIEFTTPEPPFEPIENGSTFEENSLIKAQAVKTQSGYYVLADDSGLCVEALNGRPGLYSARYAPTQDEKIEKLLAEMEDKQNRRAKFVCAMTLLNDNGEILFKTTGECHGEIAQKRAGSNGFGFDPVFIPDEGQNGSEIKTLAQMPSDTKNQISHRANALKKIIAFINQQ